MSANYQYSRILLKRSGITGTTPTINTGSTDHTDGSWSPTDLYEGELFLNSADDLMWVRTSNGILPINISGGSSSVTGGLNVGSGTQGVFAQNNAGVLEFYSFSAGSNVTITSGSSVITIASTGGGGSETAFTGLTGGLIKTIIGTAPVNQAVQDSITLFNAKATSAVTAGFAMGSPTYNKSYIGNYGSETGNINSSFAFGPGQDNVDKGVNASASVAISYQYWIKSGSTASGIIAGRQNTIGYDSNDSVIIGGSGNTINNSITGSTILGGSNITATALDTTYVPKLNIRNIGSSSPIINLGLDSSGNVVTGTTGSSADLWSASTGSNSIIANNSTGNLASASYTLAAGSGNTAASAFAVVLGGEGNSISSNGLRGFIGGGSYNSLTGARGFIGAGQTNSNTGSNGFVGAGTNNAVQTSFGVIVGGSENYVKGAPGFAYVFAGTYNTASTENAAVITGSYNLADGINSLILAGTGHTVTGRNSVILGGADINATADDTAYVPSLNIRTIGSGTSTINLGLDSSGNVVTGTTGGGTITAGNYIGASGSTTISLTGVPITLGFAISDETTAITSGATKLTFRMPHAMTVTEVMACLSTSGSTSSQFDINESGASILSTKITIDANEFSSFDATTPPVISDTSLARNSEITFDIDTAGTGAKGAKIFLIGFRTL